MGKTQAEKAKRALGKQQERHIGKVTNHGYVKEGEAYFISPGNAGVIQAIQDEYGALNAYVAAINNYVVPLYGKLARRRSKWWEEMKGDVESDLADYEYNPADRSLRPKVNSAGDKA